MEAQDEDERDIYTQPDTLKIVKVLLVATIFVL